MKSRFGSALLVVLGMLSFMVISGLAFAVFMRTTRLSSSFTRRVVTTRQLAKVALEEAIDQIDRSIGNDPHPNFRKGGGDPNLYNYWLERVLIAPFVRTTTSGRHDVVWPYDLIEKINDDLDNNKDDYSSQYDVKTVPVLSLEALAYVPPPLVNEVRYLGQKTPTAAWQTMAFDAGRYAFIAVDVSDFFDVNRILSDDARSSNPARRVTLSYLFEKGLDHSAEPATAADWDDFVEEFTKRSPQEDGSISYSSTLPFVSLADFQLALGWKDYDVNKVGPFTSPFFRYIQSDGDGGLGFYNAQPGSDLWNKYSRMTFVTDSLEVDKSDDEQSAQGMDLDQDQNSGNDHYKEDNQPFSAEFLHRAQRNRTLNDVQGQRGETLDLFLNHGVPNVALCALSDYLDCDRIPISLGMPSVERVPMICGIKPTIAETKTSVVLKRKMDEDEAGDATVTDNGEERLVKRRIHWQLDSKSFGDLVRGSGVDVLAVYPFRNHEKVAEKEFFEMDGKVQIFLSTVEMGLRSGSQNDVLRFQDDEPEMSRPGNVPDLCASSKLVRQTVFNFPLKYQYKELGNIPYASIQKPEDCLQKVDLQLDRDCVAYLNEALADEKGDVLRVTYQWKQTREKNDDGSFTEWTPLYNGQIPKLGENDVEILMSGDDKPASIIQAVDASGGTVDISSKITRDSAPEIELWLNMAVTVRVKSSEGKVLGSSAGSETKTLDLVPATAYDDELLNNVNNTGGRLQNVGGLPGPLMKFFGVKSVVNPQTSEDVAFDAETSPKAVMISDPRYNHAPENWIAKDFSNASDWYSNLAKAAAADNDGDIFMATSDQDYLQSVYELAFLPRFSDLRSFNDELYGNLKPDDYDGDGRKQLGTGGCTDGDRMWKTYDLLGRYYDGGSGSSQCNDGFDEIGLVNRGRGPKVNPYSPTTNVIMAAFANTPHDWRAASENEDEKKEQGWTAPTSGFFANHAWNAYSSGARLGWEDLEEVAGAFMDRVRVRCTGADNKTWKDALFDIFDKDNDFDPPEERLCGLELTSPSDDKIYSVDKKFLYGYWRNCFAARQQLFLVFFRAEPMMLGGGIAGAAPPQLGAKGVALVWRNPNKTGSVTGYENDDSYPIRQNQSGYTPHQTRVLFYKQFD